jgi:hypothetical protein
MRRLARFTAQNAKTVFFGYLAVSVWPFFAMRTEFNAPFPFTLKYLAAPILVFCWWIGLRYRDEFMAACRKASTFWVGLTLVPPLAVLWSAGLVLQLNAFLPPQSEIWLDGEVTAKCITGGRSKSWIVDVRSNDGIRRVEVSPQEYAALHVGGNFHQKRSMGPLGFSYVWK